MCWTFQPDDLTIIGYISARLSGQQLQVPVMDANVYESDPDLLRWDFGEDLTHRVRYYYFKRETGSREVSECSAGGRNSPGGWWKTTKGTTDIVNASNVVVGYKRPLSFRRYTDRQRDRNSATRTDWIMWEYYLPNNKKWVFCKLTCKLQPQSSTESGDGVAYNMQMEEQQRQQQHQHSPLQLDPVDYNNTDGCHDIHPQQQQYQTTIPWENVQTLHSSEYVYPQPDPMEEAFSPLFNW